MDRWLSSSWNSPEVIGRYFAVFSIATLLFGVLAPVCGLVLYKVSQRRDYYKDAAAQATDDKRRAQILELDRQVTYASETAKKSVENLNDAQAKLGQTQLQLAAATKQANQRLTEYLASKAKLQILENQSRKIVSLQLRIEAEARVPNDPNRRKNTYSALNLHSLFFSSSSNQEPLEFTCGQLEVFPVNPEMVRYVAVFEPEFPLKISGADTTLVDNRDVIASNLAPFFAAHATENATVLKIKWIIILNGAAFKLTDDTPLQGFPIIGNDGVPLSNLIGYSINRVRQSISMDYSSLFQ